jgi:hypothetical protein
VTALDNRPPTHCESRGPADGWEWHEFTGGDGCAHLYLRSELRGERSHRFPLVRPWCERRQRFPLDHDRFSVSKQKVIPKPGATCPLCADQHADRRIDLPYSRGCDSGGRP